MYFILWPEPRPCPVDDAPHTTCTSPDYHGQIVIDQLPATAANQRAAGLRADQIQATLPPGAFTSGTYRGKRRRRVDGR